jgi:hypothetical protein
VNGDDGHRFFLHRENVLEDLDRLPGRPRSRGNRFDPGRVAWLPPTLWRCPRVRLYDTDARDGAALPAVRRARGRVTTPSRRALPSASFKHSRSRSISSTRRGTHRPASNEDGLRFMSWSVVALMVRRVASIMAGDPPWLGRSARRMPATRERNALEPSMV